MERFYPELIPLTSTCKSPMSMLSTLLKTYYAEQAGHRSQEDLRGGGHALHGQEVRGGPRRAPHPVGRPVHRRGAHHARADLAAQVLRRGLPQPRGRHVRLAAGRVLRRGRHLRRHRRRHGSGAAHGLREGHRPGAARTSTSRRCAASRASRRASIDLGGTVHQRRRGQRPAERQDPARPGGQRREGVPPHRDHGLPRRLRRRRRPALSAGAACTCSIPSWPGCAPRRSTPSTASKSLRKSHENPAIQRLYEDFLGAPNSHLCHELLHTHYEPKYSARCEMSSETAGRLEERRRPGPCCRSTSSRYIEECRRREHPRELPHPRAAQGPGPLRLPGARSTWTPCPC